LQFSGDFQIEYLGCVERRTIRHKSILLLIIATSLVNSAFGSDKPIKMKDLQPAVQKAVHEHTKGVKLKGLSKEVENGKTFYEVETVVNGHSRDLLLDKTGTVVEVEEEVALDSIPAPAKSAIEGSWRQDHKGRDGHKGIIGQLRSRNHQDRQESRGCSEPRWIFGEVTRA
jgi:hypothetical protein